MNSPRIQQALNKVENLRKQLRQTFSKEDFDELKVELRRREPLEGTLILVLHLLDYLDVYLRLFDATVEAVRIVDEELDTDDDDSSSDSDGDHMKLWFTIFISNLAQRFIVHRSSYKGPLVDPGGTPGTRGPLWVQFLSFSCSFLGKMLPK